MLFLEDLFFKRLAKYCGIRYVSLSKLFNLKNGIERELCKRDMFEIQLFNIEELIVFIGVL